MRPQKPIICISNSSNQRDYTDEPARQLAIPAAYAMAVAAAGGVPVISAEQCPQETEALCDALLLSGGEDLNPSWYGETVLNDSVVLDLHRDAYEMALCKAFLAAGKPVLAICRGFQLLNVALGGDLWQDLPQQLGFVHSDKRIRHPCKAAEGSLLHRLYGAEFRVNSTHHQAVRRLGEGLWATAWSVEGIVEAYEHRTLPVFGTQFHPERMTGPYLDGVTPDFSAYFAHFVETVRGRG